MARRTRSENRLKNLHSRIAWAVTLVGGLAMCCVLPVRGTVQPAGASGAVEPAERTAPSTWTNPDCSGCHTPTDLFSHPVGVSPSFELPPDFPLFNGRITCATCHDSTSAAAHAAARQNGTDLLRGEASGADFCLQCHDQVGRDRTDLHGSMLGVAHLRWGEARTFGGVGGGLEPLSEAENSTKCLTCHDGSVASDVGHDRMTAGSGLGGVPFGQAGHPISMEYRAGQRDSSPLHLPAMLDDRIRLFNERVECASCHSMYARTEDLLVLSNDRSALCLSCHDL
jgi:predicted CXXCH cytochrome family protein